MLTAQRNLASAYDSNLVVTGDGLAVNATSFDGGIFAGTTTLYIGAQSDGTLNWWGPIRRVAYYAARLPNAELQALTS